MSNPNSPFGFMPLGYNRGGPDYDGATVERKIASGNNTAIVRGDLVQSLSTGYVAIGTSGITASLVAGIFWGCKYVSTSQGKTVYSMVWPTGDHAFDGTAFIIPIAGVPPMLFKVQSLLAPFVFADIGANADVNAGSQTIYGGYGTSGFTLDHGSLATTQTVPFRVVDLYSNYAPPGTVGTDDTSNYNIVVVQSNPDYETGIN